MKKLDQFRIYSAVGDGVPSDSGKNLQNQTLPWFLLPNFPLFLHVFKDWLVLGLSVNSMEKLFLTPPMNVSSHINWSWFLVL